MTKAKKTFNLFAISEARNVIFGIATLWIGLFHSFELTLKPYTDNKFLIDAFKFFKGTGNVGVDMFLFLSGVGLFFSFTKDGKLLNFWKKRLMRVLPTALLIGIVFFSIRYVEGRYQSGFPAYLKRISFTYFYFRGERVFWFISLILALYIVFPIFYKIIDKFRLWGMLGTVAAVVALTFLCRAVAPGFYSMWEIALCRVPSFVIGIWAGKFVKEKKEININWLWAFFAVFVVFMTLVINYTPIIKALVPGYTKEQETMYIFFYRYCGSVAAMALVVLLSWICTSIRHSGRGNVLRNFFEFVGMYSMEYYMIYLNLNHYLERIYKIPAEHPEAQIMLYFGSFIASLVLCALTRKFSDFFMDYMQRKPKNYEELRAARKARK